MDNERIEGRAAAEARPERIGLGRYLMSGMTQEEREGLALPLLRAISRTAEEECEPPATSVASAFARRTKSRAHFLHAGDAGPRPFRNWVHPPCRP